MSEEISPDIVYNERLEHYFSATAEKAQCLAWIHKRAEEIYSFRRIFIDLPVIVLSSVVGFFSIGSQSLFKGDEGTASLVLGLVSLFVSILNTTGSYFQWAKRAEGHRISSINWAHLYRFLSVQLSLPRLQRMSASDLLKHTKDAYDRLVEISPPLPPLAIRLFQSKFVDVEKYSDISKPEETNGLEAVRIYVDGLSRKSSLSIRTPIATREPLTDLTPTIEMVDMKEGGV